MLSTIHPPINSKFWQEIAHPNDPFCTDTAICSGYDVYGDILGNAHYFDYLYLLFKAKRPSKVQSSLMETLAIALANPGPRDPGVHAAMGAGSSGSTAASILYAALACGAGSYGGAREVFLMAQSWLLHGTDLQRWCHALKNPSPPTREEVFPVCEHPPGFAPYDIECRKPVLQTLGKLAEISPNGQIAWLHEHRQSLESAAKHPLALTGVAATCLIELEFSAEEAEILVLMLRLPGAAAHALEQARLGFRQFPFFSLELTDDPEQNSETQRQQQEPQREQNDAK